MPRMNEVEGRLGKPSLDGGVLDLEEDVLRRGPGGDRSYIGISKHATMRYATLDTPISSPLNFTWGNSAAISTTLRR